MSHWNRKGADTCHGGVKMPTRRHGVKTADEYGRCRPGADSKSGGAYGALEYSTSNSLSSSNISKRGTKDA
jgi:hypothetical protein